MRYGWAFLPSAAAILTLLFSTASSSFAGSATWKQSPASGEWFTAANWQPNGVPGASDIIFIGEGTGDKEWNTFHIAYTTPKDVRSTTCGHNPLPNQPIALTDLYNTPGDDFGGQGFKIIYSPRHNGGNNYVFYDGHVRWMRSFLGINWRVKE